MCVRVYIYIYIYIDCVCVAHIRRKSNIQAEPLESPGCSDADSPGAPAPRLPGSSARRPCCTPGRPQSVRDFWGIS